MIFKRLSLAFAALLLACAFNVHAQDHAGHDHAAAPAATPGAAEAGKNYFIIDPPQPTASGDKIEVLEVFSYACIHCAHFQPYADQLKASLPATAQFGYMPAIFNAQWEAYARAFYSAQALGVLDKTHQAVFDAVHRDKRPLRSFDDIAASTASRASMSRSSRPRRPRSKSRASSRGHATSCRSSVSMARRP